MKLHRLQHRLLRQWQQVLRHHLSTIQGSGYRGKILSDDIKAAFAQAQTAQEEDVAGAMKEIAEVLERRKLSSMRKAIMKNMNSSHTEIPNVTQNIKVDVTELLALRAKINEGKEKAEKVSVNDLIIKAVGKATAKFERFRTMTLEGNEYVPQSG